MIMHFTRYKIIFSTQKIPKCCFQIENNIKKKKQFHYYIQMVNIFRNFIDLCTSFLYSKDLLQLFKHTVV